MSIQKKPIRGRSAASRKRKLLRKSRYYQKSCQKLYLAAGVGIFVFVFILILAGIKGCGNYRHAKKAASDNVISMKATQDSASDSADTKRSGEYSYNVCTCDSYAECGGRLYPGNR